MGRKFLAEVETDEYYNIEIKPLSKLDCISKDKIRDKIREISEFYEKKVKPEQYKWSDFTPEEHYTNEITILKELLEE